MYISYLDKPVLKYFPNKSKSTNEEIVECLVNFYTENKTMTHKIHLYSNKTKIATYNYYSNVSFT